jgi:hypothetical protein
LLDLNNAFGKTTIRNPADVIGMQMGQQNLIDLLRPISGSAEVLEQMPAARPIKRLGAAID